MLQLFGQINKNVIDLTCISSIRICARKSLFTDQLTFYSVVEFSKDGEKFKKEFDNCKNLSDAYEQVRKYVEKVCK